MMFRFIAIGFIMISVGTTAKAVGTNPQPFVFTWEITSQNEDFKLPLKPGYQYTFVIDWGDNTTEFVGSFDDTRKIHTYAEPGIYTVRIGGLLEGWRDHNDFGFVCKMHSVVQLGHVHWKNLSHAFRDCPNLSRFSSDNSSTEFVTDISFMFYNSPLVEPETRDWDVSKVTNMVSTFAQTTSANPDTSLWDVSNVTNMSSMFANVVGAQPNTENWNISNVRFMRGMFSLSPFIQPQTRFWNLSSMQDMSYMFYGAKIAQPETSLWNVSNVNNMKGMFAFTDLAQPEVR